jgi:hypothetical protein
MADTPLITAKWIGQFYRELQAESLPEPLIQAVVEHVVQAEMRREEVVVDMAGVE